MKNFFLICIKVFITWFLIIFLSTFIFDLLKIEKSAVLGFIVIFSGIFTLVYFFRKKIFIKREALKFKIFPYFRRDADYKKEIAFLLKKYAIIFLILLALYFLAMLIYKFRLGILSYVFAPPLVNIVLILSVYFFMKFCFSFYRIFFFGERIISQDESVTKIEEEKFSAQRELKKTIPYAIPLFIVFFVLNFILIFYLLNIIFG